MKISLPSILAELGWPLGLVAVFGAVLALFGVSLDQVLIIAASLIGLWAVLSLIVNVLKTVGVVDPGTSGKWSAALNLAAIIGIAAVLAAKPDFDFAALDVQLQIVAEFGSLLLVYLTNILGTQAMHKVQVRQLGIRAFSFTG